MTQTAELPPLGITLEATVLDVHDGDTVKVRHGNLIIDVRLLDCWAPELKDEGGKESRQALLKLLPIDTTCVFHIPVKRGAAKLAHLFSMGRILGRIYTLDAIDVSQQQVADGHATKTKVK